MDAKVYKGSPIEFVRRVIRERDLEEKLLGDLSSDEAELYRTTLPMSWIPITTAAEVLDKAAAVLFPDDSVPARRLGRDLARDNLTGMYRILLRIATVPYVIEKTAKIWGAYHKRGTAVSKMDPSGKAGRVEVADYPDLPRPIRDIMSGYVVTILELTGATDINVVEEPFADGRWAWSLTWR